MEYPIRIDGDFHPSEFSSYRLDMYTYGNSRLAYATQNNCNMTRGLHLGFVIFPHKGSVLTSYTTFIDATARRINPGVQRSTMLIQNAGR